MRLSKEKFDVNIELTKINQNLNQPGSTLTQVEFSQIDQISEDLHDLMSELCQLQKTRHKLISHLEEDGEMRIWGMNDVKNGQKMELERSGMDSKIQNLWRQRTDLNEKTIELSKEAVKSEQDLKTASKDLKKIRQDLMLKLKEKSNLMAFLKSSSTNKQKCRFIPEMSDDLKT